MIDCFIRMKAQIMKKIILFALLFAISNFSYAAGPYDGIYAVNLNGFVTNYLTIHENNNKIVAIVIDINPEVSWIPMAGARTDATASVASINGVHAVDINLDVTLNFQDNGTSTATINSCVDGSFYTCKFPSGVELNLVKIF